ncbi:phospholipase A2 inhibitor and Ly6/PLAUR domain-containing protein-like [Microcaecilia unicolor]|uniref:Phospholipase A2 inhibitor and Ly6/PLAUR domain-containing protein-like n=1 Tax=Microcaecilia unicolor TaxID=1415580 RepID=A0A6P7YTP0_9AMPH|nr:phospholipase A2 inhibitor and Ly6/PLAUR domain-containing protein-like [Microcaecilia unicolor]
MRAFLSSICIFSALIVTGLCLICDHCVNLHGHSCETVSSPCKDEEVCVTTLENSTVGNDMRLSVFKGCQKYDPRIPEGIILYSGGPVFFTGYIEYCKEDNCNNGTVTVPAINMTKNGLECPACYIKGSYECTEVGTIKCIGNQEQCLEYSGELRRPGTPFEKYEYKGCATTGACDFSPSVLMGLTFRKNLKLTCM